MIGTHNGRLSAEHRKRQQAKAARNRTRRGMDTRPACNTYAACTHKKHGYTPGKAAGRQKNNRSQVWPIPVAR